MTDWIDGVRQTGWPKVVDLRADPFERAMAESDMYFRWYADKMWTFVPAQAITARFLSTFTEFPQRQKSASFNVEQALEQLNQGSPGGG